MPIAKVIEITSQSERGYEDAVRQGLAEASKTVKNIQNAWVQDHQVVLNGGPDAVHRVHLKVTFVIDSNRPA
jgi:flavin-binding protein dodecin